MNHPFRRASLALAAALVLLAGCSDAAPTEPAARAPRPADAMFSASQGALDVRQLALFDKKPSITIAWAKAWIGPEGGRLDFLGFAIEVPAGAVDRVTMFTIRLPVDPTGSERVVAEFGPHGKTFARPVAIELPYAGTSIFGAEGSTVVWGNPLSGAWEDVGAQVTADGLRLRATTTHFSTYGTSAFRSGGLLASGG